MAIKKRLNKSQRRCQKKPRKHLREQGRRMKARESDSDESFGRLDDGASRAYRKLGRAEYERYAKHLAQVYWDVPEAGNSGLFLQTSKYRLRGGPTHDQDTDLLTQGFPQPHYTLKIMKTAYKIFRIRMKKRSGNSANKHLFLSSENTQDEESTWAYILDRPLLEQYILLLRYIRNLASKLASEMGHREVICSETPLRVIEQLHPLKRLDFREAKHYLPQPLIESSDSDTQLKIDRELDRLDRAIRKRQIEKQKEKFSDVEGMYEAEDYGSSSSSTTTEDLDGGDFGKKKAIRDKKNIYPHFSNLLERQGEVYRSYKDPGSEESIFVEFADLEEHAIFKISSMDLEESSEDPVVLETYDDNDDDEQKKHQHILESETKDEVEFYEEYTRNLRDGGLFPPKISSIPSLGGGSSTGGGPLTGGGSASGGGPSTSGDPSTFNDDNENDYEPSTSSKPGGSSQNDNLENGSEATDEEEFEIRSNISNAINEIQRDGEMCTITVTCHGDHMASRIRTKRIVNQTNTTEEVNEEHRVTMSNQTQNAAATAGGDASTLMFTINDASITILYESIKAFQSLITNIANFAKTSNDRLDKFEKSLRNIEKVIPKPNRKDWNEVKRQMRLVIRRYSKDSDTK